MVWLKNIGITHVSLPPAQNVAELSDLLSIIRRLEIEADLEGPVPDELQALTRAHGGPLTGPLPGPPLRISALSATAAMRSREALDFRRWGPAVDGRGRNAGRGGVSSRGREFRG